jgi:hypothetical protein
MQKSPAKLKLNNHDPDRILTSAISNAAMISDEGYGYVAWGITNELWMLNQIPQG